MTALEALQAGRALGCLERRSPYYQASSFFGGPGARFVGLEILIIIILVGSRWDYAHGRGPGPAPGELGLSAAKRAIDNWNVGDGQVRR